MVVKVDSMGLNVKKLLRPFKTEPTHQVMTVIVDDGFILTPTFVSSSVEPA